MNRSTLIKLQHTINNVNQELLEGLIDLEDDLQYEMKSLVESHSVDSVDYPERYFELKYEIKDAQEMVELSSNFIEDTRILFIKLKDLLYKT